MASGSSTMSRFSHTALSKPANSAQSDFENYLHALCFKAVQVIVEARLGERISTPSKPDVFGTDWFNIALNKQEEVRKETKKALSGSLPSPGIPLCVEISLKTSDGDVMTLECWQLNVDEPSPSSSPVSPGKSSYLVYNRMSALLKTLISVTRTTPAYGVSRRQSRDAYVICYRVYLGQPTTDTLGPEVKSVKMGPISSPMGSVAMGVTYRTRLALSPHKLERSAPVMLKSDHFEAGSDERATSSFAGTTFARGDETRNSDKNPVGWFEKQTLLSRKNCGAFVDFDESSTECLVPDLTASFPWIAESSGSSGSSSKTDSSRPNPSSSGPIAVAPTSGLRRTRPSGDRLSVASSSESPPPEDFVVVSTSPPFASRDSDVEDLPAFYDALSVATKVPLLSSFDDQIESVEDQLKSLEFDKKEFDSFVNELSSREDMTVSEATAAEMSDEECDEPKKEERGGGGRLHAAVPMPLRSTSLWISC